MVKRMVRVDKKIHQIRTKNCPLCGGSKFIYRFDRKQKTNKPMQCPRCYGHGWVTD